jgi:hypothetical protein
LPAIPSGQLAIVAEEGERGEAAEFLGHAVEELPGGAFEEG